MAEKLIGGATHLIRIAASPIILRDHLPGMLKKLRGRFPKLKLTMREGLQPDIEQWLHKQEIDLAVTAIEGKPPAGIKAQKLLDLPIALLAHKAARIKTLEDVTTSDRIAETLISLPANEAVSRHVSEGAGQAGRGLADRHRGQFAGFDRHLRRERVRDRRDGHDPGSQAAEECAVRPSWPDSRGFRWAPSGGAS